MSSTLQYILSVIGVGRPIQKTALRSGNTPIVFDADLSPGKAGTLTTRTSDTAGVVTLASGHGITTSDKLDIYFAAGRRYNATVSATTGTTVTFSAGAGDNLPTQDAAIVACKQTLGTVNLDGDTAKLVASQAVFELPTSVEKTQLTFKDSGGAVIAHIDLVGSSPNIVDIEGGDTNIFTGNPVTQIGASNGSSTYDCNMLVTGIQP